MNDDYVARSLAKVERISLPVTYGHGHHALVEKSDWSFPAFGRLNLRRPSFVVLAPLCFRRRRQTNAGELCIRTSTSCFGLKKNKQSYHACSASLRSRSSHSGSMFLMLAESSAHVKGNTFHIRLRSEAINFLDWDEGGVRESKLGDVQDSEMRPKLRSLLIHQQQHYQLRSVSIGKKPLNPPPRSSL